MKTLVLAGMLGSGLCVAAPSLSSLVIETRKPFSWHGAINTPLPRMSTDFVLTDVVVDGGFGNQTVTVDVGGQIVAQLQTKVDAATLVSWNLSTWFSVEPLHLNSGIPVPSGAIVTVLGTAGNVTVSGYYN
jgi:hypothetical protein